MDICFTSTTVPKMLANHVSGHKGISYSSCLIKIFFFIWFADIDSFLLTILAHNHYAVICHPLYYAASATPQFCGLLGVASWDAGFRNALTHTVLPTCLSFCTHQVPHFFCDLSPLLKLACSDTFLNNAVGYTVEPCPSSPPLWASWSPTHIFAAVLKSPSTTGKRTAFSTCSSISLWCYCSVGCSLGFISAPWPPTQLKEHGSCSDVRCAHPHVDLLHLSLCSSNVKGTLGALVGRKPVFVQ